MDFPRGLYYQIICMDGDRVLRMQQTQPGKYEKSAISYEPLNQKSEQSLWMIQKIGQGDSDFQIVNCKSTFVMDQQGIDIKLRKGKRANDQLYALREAVEVNAKAFHKYYYILGKANGAQGLYLQGTLKYGALDTNKQNYLFRFERVQNHPALDNSWLLINNATQKALDVPQATFKPQKQIVQYEKNWRWNQRWRLVPQNNNSPWLFIESLLNGLVLDIKGGKMKDGVSVIQWNKTGDDNQLWRKVPDGPNFKFCSKKDEGFFLHIEKDSNKDSAGLEIYKQGTTFRVSK